MGYLGSGPAPKATALDANTVETEDIKDGAVTAEKIAPGAVGTVSPSGVSDQPNTSTGYFDLPSGTTAERPGSPSTGMIRFNTTTGLAEVYDGNIWAEFGAPPPSISSVTPSTYNGESGTTFTINGANFTADATVFFVTSGGTEVLAGSVSFISGTQLTATTPQDFTVADEPLDVKVVQSSGQITRLSVIDCGGVPAWSTSSGQLGSTTLQGEEFSATVEAVDPDANSSIGYLISSGSLPSGLSLNQETGAIAGTAPEVSGDTTFNFELAAVDNAGNSTARAFNIIIADPKAETSGGLGYKTIYSDTTNGTPITNTAMPQIIVSSYFADPNNPGEWLNYDTGAFTIHAGHDGGMQYLAVRVSSGTPVVLNQYQWKAHQNGCGNVDFFGSNKDITSANIQDLINWSFLGRGHFGGYSGSSEFQSRSISINPNNYGYKWYMAFVRDNGGPLEYPNVGSMGGYAMYGARFNKV